MEDIKENVIEFLKGSDTATLSLTQGRYITRVRELAKKRPNECKIMRENTDGSIVAHIPTSWVKIHPTRELSDEQREILVERANRMNLQKSTTSDD